MKDRLKVAVLSGGFSAEDYLSRRSGALILEHANRDKYLCSLFDWNAAGWVAESAPGEPDHIIQRHESILAAFATPKRFDIVVNTLHGEMECDGQLQGMFELAKQPYTGNGRASSIIGMNKILSKKIMREAGLLTPDWLALTAENLSENTDSIKAAADQFGFPLIVKAATGGSSNSILMADNEQQMFAAIKSLSDVYDEVYLEPFLDGLEYTVAVFGEPGDKPLTTLPVARIAYEGMLFDAAIKKADRYQVLVPCGLIESEQKELMRIAEQLHYCFRFNAFSRVDFRYAGGKPYLLEVNTHPGLGENSIVPLMLKAAGISWETVIDWLVENGLNRKMR
ncbi:D-alanine--D-alanine ligase family protein [Undibacterium sp. SXout7W]|uniref:D-alanine--D-alanine ligase family protein n=1 Tax=Undibacterium sp. SXout7W TaxID=3413049 RepID=UPI003BF41B78